MKLAILGDLHQYFDDIDVDYFNHSDYEFLIFTGDLPDFFHLKSKIYKTLSKIKKKSFLIWGNHDGFSFLEVVGEIFQKEFLKIQKKDFDSIEQKLNKIQNQLGNYFITGGYRIEKLFSTLAIFMVRPHSMGGSHISYKEYMKKKYNVTDLDSSYKKLKEILDEFLKKNQITSLIFLGHNGPYGISSNPFDLWGCDFNPDLGDFGDKDFQNIIQYAKSLHLKIPLVIGGHMHHKLSKKVKDLPVKERKSIQKIENTYYLNPAKVPRIQEKKRYYISVSLERDQVKKIHEVYF